MTPPGCLGALLGLRSTPAEETPTSTRTVPDTLPVRTKDAFFSSAEKSMYETLQSLCAGTTLSVFPNVRLGDVFTITDPQQRSSTHGRLRDKHVDFLILDRAAGYRPVVGLELDGPTHTTPAQQHADAVKTVVFRSAALPLLRVDHGQHTPETLRKLLAPYIRR